MPQEGSNKARSARAPDANGASCRDYTGAGARAIFLPRDREKGDPFLSHSLSKKRREIAHPPRGKWTGSRADLKRRKLEGGAGYQLYLCLSPPVPCPTRGRKRVPNVPPAAVTTSFWNKKPAGETRTGGWETLGEREFLFFFERE